MSALLQRSESLPQALLAPPARRHALFGVPRSPRSCRQNGARLQPPAPGAPRRTRELTGVARLSWRRREPGSGQHNRPHYRGRHSHLDKKVYSSYPHLLRLGIPPHRRGRGRILRSTPLLSLLCSSQHEPPRRRGGGSPPRAPLPGHQFKGSYKTSPDDSQSQRGWGAAAVPSPQPSPPPIPRSPPAPLTTCSST